MLIQITIIHFVEVILVSALAGATIVAMLMVMANRKRKA